MVGPTGECGEGSLPIGHGVGGQAPLRTALPQYPLITDFGEEHGFPLYEIKDGSLLEVEKVSLQQRLNQFQHEVSPWALASQPAHLPELPAPSVHDTHHLAPFLPPHHGLCPP